MKDIYVEYLKGFSVGGIQILFGHPFDTIKTNIQANKNINIYKLYKGVSYPFFTNSFINSFVFGSYSYIYKETNNHFISGFISGLFVGPIITPIDKLKINQQIGNILYKNKYRNLFTGIYITSLRESFGTGIYFSSYNYFKNLELVKGDINILIAGGNAGLLSWLLTYPLDVIKTRIQSEQEKHIISAFNKGNLFSGLKVCLLRSFLVNSIGFYVYEKLK